jgi:ubiquinol-cytochrome c reductase cytochrome b subunit
MSLWGLVIKPQMFGFYLTLYFILITPFFIGFIHTKNIAFVRMESQLTKVRLKGIYRIGPHNKDVISIIFGSLLGDGHAEKRLAELGTRISFYQEDIHIEYLLNLHKMLSEIGYCNPKIPIVRTRLGTKGKVRKIIRFST